MGKATVTLVTFHRSFILIMIKIYVVFAPFPLIIFLWLLDVTKLQNM